MMLLYVNSEFSAQYILFYLYLFIILKTYLYFIICSFNFFAIIICIIIVTLFLIEYNSVVTLFNYL